MDWGTVAWRDNSEVIHETQSVPGGGDFCVDTLCGIPTERGQMIAGWKRGWPGHSDGFPAVTCEQCLWVRAHTTAPA